MYPCTRIWPTIFLFGFVSEENCHIMKVPLPFLTYHSVKYLNQNGSETKPHPPSTLVSYVSYQPKQSDVNLQFTIFGCHKEKFIKLKSSSIYTMHSLKDRWGVTKWNDHLLLDMLKKAWCATLVFVSSVIKRRNGFHNFDMHIQSRTSLIPDFQV